MNLRTRLAIRFIRRHPWHTGLSVVGIALGIAVVLAIDITNESARRAFHLTNDAIAGGSTHYIHGGPQGVAESLYTELRIAHGMTHISPVVSGYVSFKDERFLLLGMDPFSGSGGMRTDPAHSGPDPVQLLKTPNGALILASTAERLDLVVPTSVTVRISGVDYPLQLIDTLAPSNELHRHGLRNVLVTDIATAQVVLGMVGRLTRIDVSTDDSEEVGRRLPNPLRIVANESRSHAMQQMTRAFHLNLTALSLLALVIGAFLIYNTMTLSVLQRREYFSVLRVLGMTPRQLFTDIIIEALILAAAGFVVGTVLGIWLSTLLIQLASATINDLYFAVRVQSITVPLTSLFKAGALAVMATVAASWHPAWEAMRANPMLNSLRSQVEAEARQRSSGLMLAGIGLWGAAGVILLISDTSITAGFVALFCLIIGFAVMTPLILSKVLAMLHPVLEKYLGTLGRIAGRGVLASLSRTQIAVAALAIAVSAVIGVSVMISSFRVSVEQWLYNFLRADIYIAQQLSHQASGVDRQLIASIAARPQVKAVSTGRWIELQSDTGPIQLFAVDLDRYGFENFQLADGDSDQAWPTFTATDAVIVSEPYAYHNRIETGDSINLPADDGDGRFKVVGIFYDYGSDRGVVAMHRTTYDRHWKDPVISSFALYLHEGVDVEGFVDELNRDELVQQILRVRSNHTLRDKSLEIFDRTFVITDVLRLLAICIAVVGILSALMAIQLERAKEFAVLRAIGLSPRQLWGLVTTESGLMGLVAGVIACPLGLAMSWVLIFIINRRSFGWSMDFYFHPGPWLTALVLSMVAAVIAGLYPAARMSKAPPAESLRYE